MAKLSEMVMVRVTPEMKTTIDICANRLKLRPADIVRYLLASGLEEVETKKEKVGRIIEIKILSTEKE